MISSVKTFIRYMYSPRLYKIYGQTPNQTAYQENSLEKWGDRLYSSTFFLAKYGMYATPILLIMFYDKNWILHNSPFVLLRIATCVGLFFALGLLMKGTGRLRNPKYCNFVQVLESASGKPHDVFLEQIRKFDFDYNAWPVSFSMDMVQEVRPLKEFLKNPPSRYGNRHWLPILADLATHTFALSMIYPGSMALLAPVMHQAQVDGRATLYEINGGKRYKLKSVDGNFVDCMLVDNRSNTSNGKTLVICCEGNCGCYEFGIMMSPMDAGYSTLGWNHPGFGCSTGKPYPSQEQSSMDIVVQFAIHKLGFPLEQIAFFGWSIGGYTATWAAVNYPECRGLILDATFDDLLPLAQARMPRAWAPLVEELIRRNVNLNIAELLNQYAGPVLLIRRSHDEMICLEDGQIGTNRGNFLLLKLLQHRHPALLGHTQAAFLLRFLATEAVPNPAVVDEFVKKLTNFDPTTKRILYLTSQYMRDFKSTHCPPLPSHFFEIPKKIE